MTAVLHHLPTATWPPPNVRVPQCPPWCDVNLDNDAIEGHEYAPDCFHHGYAGKVTVDGEVFGVWVTASEDSSDWPAHRDELHPHLSLSNYEHMRTLTPGQLAQYVPELVQQYADMLWELVRTGRQAHGRLDWTDEECRAHDDKAAAWRDIERAARPHPPLRAVE